MNKQSRWGSLLEAWWQPFVGFFISVWLWNLVVWPGIQAGYIDPTSGIVVNGIFFVASFIRSYILRRASVAWSAWRARRVEKTPAPSYNGASLTTTEDPIDGYPT